MTNLIKDIFDLINFYRQSFSQGESEGGETETIRRIPGPISTCQAQPAFEAYAFDLINFYRHDTVQSRRIKRRKKLKLSLSRIPGPISTCQAQPAFEAYAFHLINLYRHGHSQGESEAGRN